MEYNNDWTVNTEHNFGSHNLNIIFKRQPEIRHDAEKNNNCTLMCWSSGMDYVWSQKLVR